MVGLLLAVLAVDHTTLGNGLDRYAHVLFFSLDEVEDTATQLLMTEFYWNLTNGLSKRESFFNAQQFLRQYNNGQYDKLEYWAAFIMFDGIE